MSLLTIIIILGVLFGAAVIGAPLLNTIMAMGKKPLPVLFGVAVLIAIIAFLKGVF